ncbi:MAG: hypothetical protein SFX72_21105 [Isosphaeraceae bacterium]|nr:hypothetical protein [Isosphaeraceae bacterium]
MTGTRARIITAWTAIAWAAASIDVAANDLIFTSKGPATGSSPARLQAIFETVPGGFDWLGSIVIRDAAGGSLRSADFRGLRFEIVGEPSLSRHASIVDVEVIDAEHENRPTITPACELLRLDTKSTHAWILRTRADTDAAAGSPLNGSIESLRIRIQGLPMHGVPGVNIRGVAFLEREPLADLGDEPERIRPTTAGFADPTIVRGLPTWQGAVIGLAITLWACRRRHPLRDRARPVIGTRPIHRIFPARS